MEATNNTRLRQGIRHRHGNVVHGAHLREHEGLSDAALAAVAADNCKRQAWRVRSAWLLEAEQKPAREQQKPKGGAPRSAATDPYAFSPKAVAKKLAEWIETFEPNAFVTTLMPITDESRTRVHGYYLRRWTRQAETALWGSSARRVRNLEDRVLWLFVKETSADGMAHWHAACRMPTRPMRIERENGSPLSLADRCALLQQALIDASKRTPQPYRQNAPGATAEREVEMHVGAGSSLLHDVRGADVQVKPFVHPRHANYMVKQRPLTRDDGDGLLILP